MFRLAQHDAHSSLRGKNLISGDATHNVNRNSDATNVNICFACHNALSTGRTPWATDWSVASPATSCIACHEHVGNHAPNVACK